MDNKKKDRRIRKTEKLLLDGLTTLMETKSINNITVRELADLVDINRSTFYLHYQDIYDMIDHVEMNLIDKFTEALDTNKEIYDKPNNISNLDISVFEQQIKLAMEKIFLLVYENHTICRALMGPNGDVKFLTRIRKIISDRITYLINQMAKDKFSEVDLELAQSYFISGAIGLVRCWLDFDKEKFNRTTPAYMATLFVNLMRGETIINHIA